MEDYLVIILTLIIAVVGVLNRKKKKTVTPNPVQGEAQKSSDLWDMIMDEQEIDEEPLREYIEPEPEYLDPEPVVPDNRVPQVVTPSYTFSEANEGKSTIKDGMNAVEKKTRRVTIDGEKFSLRKAVIYSEIMKRKYS